MKKNKNNQLAKEVNVFEVNENNDQKFTIDL